MERVAVVERHDRPVPLRAHLREERAQAGKATRDPLLGPVTVPEQLRVWLQVAVQVVELE